MGLGNSAGADIANSQIVNLTYQSVSNGAVIQAGTARLSGAYGSVTQATNVLDFSSGKLADVNGQQDVIEGRIAATQAAAKVTEAEGEIIQNNLTKLQTKQAMAMESTKGVSMNPNYSTPNTPSTSSNDKNLFDGSNGLPGAMDTFTPSVGVSNLNPVNSTSNQEQNVPVLTNTANTTNPLNTANTTNPLNTANPAKPTIASSLTKSAPSTTIKKLGRVLSLAKELGVPTDKIQGFFDKRVGNSKVKANTELKLDGNQDKELSKFFEETMSELFKNLRDAVEKSSLNQQEKAAYYKEIDGLESDLMSLDNREQVLKDLMDYSQEQIDQGNAIIEENQIIVDNARAEKDVVDTKIAQLESMPAPDQASNFFKDPIFA